LHQGTNDGGSSSPAGTPIEGAVALVTAGNRGFGRAFADELLERGAAKVYATSRSPQRQRDERIVPLVLDVADDESVAAAAQAAPDVSIVVNNAGIGLSTPVLDAPLADIRTELETSLFGMIRIAAGVRSGPRPRSPQRHGQRAVGSVVARDGQAWWHAGCLMSAGMRDGGAPTMELLR
jgi:NAD(P)-dependent dehydrogenase (short-subunit alcohol dehydrogenase family)